ncbi:MAG: hypothetical protein ACI8WB_006064 [Phenylobacterium sp.]|jgi:hypothetical protein
MSKPSRFLRPVIVGFTLLSAALSAPVLAADKPTIQFTDVTATNLPQGLNRRCMDVEAHDIDGDNDVDLILAMEFARNILLINNGKGVFSRSNALPNNRRDSEDIAVADFDLDGLLDILVVSEDDEVNEFYLNQGKGAFKDASYRIRFKGTSNAVVSADLNGDGASDVIIGNVGKMGVLINDGKGDFINESKQRLPNKSYRVQDLALVDVDADGDLDLLTGDEVQNRLFINNGKGVFDDQTSTRLPKFKGITREVTSADIDNDGDQDIYYANVSRNPGNAPNRLLLNNGKGFFTEVSASHLPTDAKENNFTARFVELNGDNAIDLIVPDAHINGSNNGIYRAYINSGDGHFTEVALSPSWPRGNGFDVAEADFNGDGKTDLYLCNRARRNFTPANGGADALLFGG